MKKKLLAVVLAGVMSMSMLTACGGTETTAEVEKAAVEEETEAEETTEDASGDMCSDETFSILQDNYATMVDCYNAVKELYESDEIAADADIEDTMNKAADVINQMGEITQDTITEADAEDLNSAMVDILDALENIVDAMQTTGDVAGDVCSDDTFATLQDNYAVLTDAYNVVYDAYMSDEIEQNDDIEDALNQTADIINEMGEISQDTITEADAEALNDSMLTLLDVLDAVVDAM